MKLLVITKSYHMLSDQITHLLCTVLVLPRLLKSLIRALQFVILELGSGVRVAFELGSGVRVGFGFDSG